MGQFCHLSGEHEKEEGGIPTIPETNMDWGEQNLTPGVAWISNFVRLYTNIRGQPYAYWTSDEVIFVKYTVIFPLLLLEINIFTKTNHHLLMRNMVGNTMKYVTEIIYYINM